MINCDTSESQILSNKKNTITLRVFCDNGMLFNQNEIIVIGEKSTFLRNNSLIIIRDKDGLFHYGLVTINQEYIKLRTITNQSLFFGKDDFTFIANVKERYYISAN